MAGKWYNFAMKNFAMKKRIAFLLAVLAVLAAATAFADMPRRGAAVFADGFDQPGTFAENRGKTPCHTLLRCSR